MTPMLATLRSTLILLATLTLPAGCASFGQWAPTPAEAPKATAPGAAVPAAAVAGTETGTAAGKPAGTPAAAAAPAPGAPKPFADVIKDATEFQGLITLWRKEEKVWMELRPDQFGQPMFLAINLSRGLGEKHLHAGAMGAGYTAGDAFVVEFRKIGPQVQLIAKNSRFTARPGSPEEIAVKRGFSDSLLGSATVASQPHPERKSLLIEANALLLADLARGAHAIERAYRNTFTFDARHSHFVEVRANPAQTTVDINAHYTQSRIPLPAAVAGSAPFHPPPAVLEDPRSLFLGFLYSFTKLPEQPMRPRLADARLGHFRTARVDFSDERRVNPQVFFVERWRLEKKDPQAELSEPVKPIVFWLDREIPERYRGPISEGILEWNKAFARIGLKDAIRVEVQPAGADFDTGDTLHASVRWMTTAKPSYGAIGPRHVDPRTGEILDADIGIDANTTRSYRFFRREVVADALAPMYDESGAPRPEALGIDPAGARFCGYAEHAAREFGFALAMREARGEIDPEGPQAERFVAEYLKDTTMHEVGHTLGLAHNFRASTTYTAAQLADPEFTEKNGIAGSVMDYHPFNLAAKGEAQGPFGMRTIGPYDYWAIEYAYRPLPADREGEELAKIAARSSEPLLAFASDYDVFESLDPEVNQLDLGADALAYYRKRVTLSLELWERLETRTLKPGESYEMLRRRFFSGFGQIGRSLGLAAKYVGGAVVVRDHAGSNRAPITPVPADRQREALALISESLFKVDSFRVSPDFLRRLTPDPLAVEHEWSAVATGSMVALPDMVLSAQRDVLNRLLSPLVAQRLLVHETQATDPRQVLSLGELYATLQASIWAEAQAGGEVGVLRRNLQREHLRRIAGALLGPTAGLPADARSLHRINAQRLREQLAAALGSSGLSREANAHYSEALETLGEVLKAPLLRSGV